VWVRAAVAILLACAVAAGTAAEPVRGVSGRWYTEGTEEDTYIRYLVERADDGTFKAEVKARGDCAQADSWIETGRWTFRDGTLFTRTETVSGMAVDGDDEQFSDSFLITVINDDNVTMFDTETKISWSVRRVGADFKIPPDPACAV
jgi:hypothetical protein